MSRSQPVSPAPRTSTPKLSTSSVRRPVSSDGLRRIVEPNHVADATPSRRAQQVNTFSHDARRFPDPGLSEIVSYGDGATNARRDISCVTNGRRDAAPPPASRPLNKVKSDSCLPPKGYQQARHAGQLRHRVTINTIPIVPSLTVTPSFSMTPSLPIPPPPHRTQRSHSSSNLMPLVAPLAEIDEHSIELDFQRFRMSEQSGIRRRDPPPMLMVNDGRKSLSLTKITDAPIYISVPQIRRNASWTTMTSAMTSAMHT